ncbi:MAG: hypothetical protein HFI47_09575 [Lachnospiraceae bacterium]|nr:hypothetical protein [Lachnospiraceae bacterium]
MTVIRRRPGRQLWERFREYMGKGGTDAEAEEIIAGLYPGESVKKRYAQYQSRKYAAMITVTAAGAAAALCLHLGSRMQDRLAEGNHLYRNEWGEGDYAVTLLAETTAGIREFNYEVEERAFSQRELENLKDRLCLELPGLVAGKNENLGAVREDLSLAARFEGYPFAVAWRSSDYEKIRTDGKVMNQGLPGAGEEVILTAVLSYGESRWEKEIKAVVVPEGLDREQEFHGAIERLLEESDMGSKTSQVISLPQEVHGEAISWREKKQDYSLLPALAGMIGAVLTANGMKRDLRQKNRNRREEIERLYPEFVSKLQLYMGAGLTVKNAFLRMGKDYQREKKRKGKRLFLYEEVLICDYQLLNGVAEDDAYREWGKRCGELRCRKLGFLLAAQLRQGNDRMLALLSEEADLALLERRRSARRKGEEAGTKLLFPMLIMLIVVMFLILLPALNGFGAI